MNMIYVCSLARLFAVPIPNMVIISPSEPINSANGCNLQVILKNQWKWGCHMSNVH